MVLSLELEGNGVPSSGSDLAGAKDERIVGTDLHEKVFRVDNGDGKQNGCYQRETHRVL